MHNVTSGGIKGTSSAFREVVHITDRAGDQIF
jgi:hypothetical protein